MPVARFPVSIPDVWALPVSVPAPALVSREGAAARGCQARRHDVEDNVKSGCQAPPVDAPLPRSLQRSGRHSEFRIPNSEFGLGTGISPPGVRILC